MTPGDRGRGLVFLGGTVGENPWRKGFIERLVARGVPRATLFDPVVEDWDEAARTNEERAKNDPNTLLLFYLADPQEAGMELSAYSLVEATLAVCDEPDRTVLVFDLDAVDGHARKVLDQTEKLLRQRAPRVPVFHSLRDAEDWVAARFGTSEQP